MSAIDSAFGPNDSPMMWPLADVVPGACPGPAPAPAGATDRDFSDADAPPPNPELQTPHARGGVCFSNDGPAGGSLEGRIRAVLVQGFSHEPKPGEDGRITVHIKSLRVGASHGATEVDQVQYQTRPRSTIYDVRATFDTCTDYNRRDVFVTRERNFACFTKASGVFDCSMTGNTPGLAHDVSREVLK